MRLSATNRGRIRKAHDDYPTPLWATYRLLEALSLKYHDSVDWLEPSAGRGHIIRAVNNFRHHNIASPSRRSNWIAVEKQLSYADALFETAKFAPPSIQYDIRVGDFLNLDLPHKSSRVVIGNPPYRLALEFIQRSFLIADSVIFLLRLNFLGSRKRQSFWQTCMPQNIWVLPNRPSCGLNKQGKKGTDACEYGWFMWESVGACGSSPTLYLNRQSNIQVLGLTDHQSDLIRYGE